jgi:hypothetical protein
MMPSRLLCRRALRRVTVAGLRLLAVVAALPLQAPGASDGEFSGARAYEALLTIARDIGPRPMGSPAEQRALAFAAAKFKEYGCDTSYVLPMTVAEGVNTSSGIAVGIARGHTGRMIVIGGHMDSSGPDIPGANDDGSGSACVIELARVLVPRDLQSTIVFCCFGGEESGLRGSTHFVKVFPSIDSVALMLQIDMTDGSSYLEMDPDAAFQVSSPRWLPRAAFDIYYNQLGFSDLRYLTHTSTLNYSTPGGTGSDHIPFIEKGIPAIDFTSDVTYPIHSPLDNLATFDSSGLARSGLLVQRLVERFDAGVPSRGSESYYLMQIGTHLVFVDHWALWVLHFITLLVTIVVVVRLRRARVRDRSSQPRWSTTKLILTTLMIQAFLWVPESFMGVLRGYRYPWVNNVAGYFALAFLCGAVGVWFALRVLHRLRISADPYVYFLRMAIILGGVTIALALANPEIALYTGSALLCFSLAVLVRRPIVKGALLLAALYLPLHMVFLEALGLLQRGMAGASINGSGKVGLTDGVYIVLFTLMSLPFMYGIAAAYRSAAGDLFWLRKFGHRMSLAVLFPAILVLAIVLLHRPVYDATWQRTVRAEQRYTIGADTSTLHISGGEFLDGLHVNIAGRDTIITGDVNVYDPALGRRSGVDWVRISSHQRTEPDSALSDSSRTLARTVALCGTRRPLKVEITYRSDQDFALKSAWSTGSRTSGVFKSDKSKTLTWYAFPDSILDVPVTLTMRPGQKVIERVELTYPDLAAPVALQRELTTVTLRTYVSKTDTIAVN